MQSLYRAGFGLLGIIVAFAGSGVSPASAAQFSTLYSFCPDQPTCSAGSQPTGIFAAANGDLYGTAYNNNNASPNPSGFIFKMTRGAGGQYTYSQFFSFPACASNPNCPSGIYPSYLIIGKSGAVYGVAQGGTGGNERGILFKITPGGQETVLYNFCSQANCTDGAQPDALTYLHKSDGADWDEVSPLYGVTAFGGTGYYGLGGTAFKYDPGTTQLTTIYNFCVAAGCHDGMQPGGELAMTKGLLYGVNDGNSRACGILWQLNLNQPHHARALHDFAKRCNTSDGDGTVPTGVLLSRNPGTGRNVLSGLAAQGGTGGVGEEWTYDPATGDYQVLTNFCPFPECLLGYSPGSALVKDARGNWYGFNTRGDSTGNPSGHGELFVTDQYGNGTAIHDFATGDQPLSPLVRWKNRIFGVTYAGGANGSGSVYMVLTGN
ncbi:MAG TPA: choice-of-anchor tandem repeat GloVer-containing protein [Rhizomicrobium sp.]|nr:choice-of-anchor tandem repeat GloVer-containing protein [Rhizomicrobium sp.]